MRGRDRAKYLLHPCKEEYSFASVVTLQKEVQSRNMARSIIFFGLIRISNRFGSVQFNNVNVERKYLDWTPYWYRPLAKKLQKKKKCSDHILEQNEPKFVESFQNSDRFVLKNTLHLLFWLMVLVML